MKIHGFDVSYANPTVDFRKAKKAGMAFAIIRTGYSQKKDVRFDKHMTAAKAVGMPVGVYCYCMARTVKEAQKEAEFVLTLIKPYQLTYPVFYDIEDERLSDLSKRDMTDIVIAFCDTIEKAGYFPAIYINPAWLEAHVYKDMLKKYDIWLAAWTNSRDKPTKYKYGQTMWQWGAEKKSFATGLIDSDICYIDYPKKIKALGLNNLTTTLKVVAEYKTLTAVNIRAAASVKGARVATLMAGAAVQAMSKTKTADGYKWLNVKYNGASAWIAYGTADGKQIYLKKTK